MLGNLLTCIYKLCVGKDMTIVDACYLHDFPGFLFWSHVLEQIYSRINTTADEWTTSLGGRLPAGHHFVELSMSSKES
eukprot:12305930-Karenia_brevis.AAC.1